MIRVEPRPAAPAPAFASRPAPDPRRAARIAQVKATLAEQGVRKIAALDAADAVTHIGVMKADPRVIVLRRAPKPSGAFVDAYVLIEDATLGLNDMIVAALDDRVGPRFATLDALAAHLARLAGDIAMEASHA